MNGSIVAAKAEDGYILHGIHCKPAFDSHAAVLHFHGSYGNFYENTFLTPMADSYVKAGLHFFSCNTRGRDYYADFKKMGPQGIESRRIGGIREDFRECLFDIAGWASYAAAKGITTIFIQGHSLGAMKAVYYLHKRHCSARGVILLSPPDNIGLQLKDWGSRLKGDIQLAIEISRKDPNALMPAESYYDMISASSFLTLLGNSEDTGMFTYQDIDLMKRAGMSSIKIPLLVTFGTIDEAIVNPVEDCLAALRSSIPDPAKLASVVIEGANHGYRDREVILAEALATWTTSNMG
jgi:pimeloyl-ACP methyl ester carboxylesterase